MGTVIKRDSVKNKQVCEDAGLGYLHLHRRLDEGRYWPVDSVRVRKTPSQTPYSYIFLYIGDISSIWTCSSGIIELIIDPDTWDLWIQNMVTSYIIEFRSKEEPTLCIVSYQRNAGLTEVVQSVPWIGYS